MLYPFKNGKTYNCQEFKLEFKRSSTGLVFHETCKIISFLYAVRKGFLLPFVENT